MRAEILTSTVGTKDESKGRVVRKAKVINDCELNDFTKAMANVLVPALCFNLDWDSFGEDGQIR